MATVLWVHYFPYFNVYKYILVEVDYVFKWMEVVALLTNDEKFVVNFGWKNIFTRLGAPPLLISDEGNHFCNKLLDNHLA